jgi:hypothetical protein
MFGTALLLLLLSRGADDDNYAPSPLFIPVALHGRAALSRERSRMIFFSEGRSISSLYTQK